VDAARRRHRPRPPADRPRLRRRGGDRRRSGGDRPRRGRDPDGDDETLADDFSILSERYDGTFAERVAVPARNLVAKPASLSFEEAACLPVAYLTAYRMLFTRGDLRPGERVLVQGAGGGVATALVLLARAAGPPRHRHLPRRGQARTGRGARRPPRRREAGERLPHKVDAVMETVGEATWKHSLRALGPAAVVVVVGATSGMNPPADLARVFYRQLEVVGSTMGTKRGARAPDLHARRDGRPPADRRRAGPLTDARDAFARMVDGDLFGKLVLQVG
jgi:NADPH:quinone reductase-like Zn-dependent oxidoreductase